MAERSSARTIVDTTSQPSALQRATTAGPERSSFFPVATESLIVRTETRMAGVAGLAFGGGGCVAAALLFIDHALPFHQKPRRRSGDCRAFRAGIEINFELAIRPADCF